jgi:glucose/arabinose dehydrogenase
MNVVLFLLIAILFIPLTLLTSLYGQPATTDSKLKVEQVFAGKFKPSTMELLVSGDILLLDRDQGKVYKVSDGAQKVILDVNVSTIGYRGLLGVAVFNKNNVTQNVFLYFTEAQNHDGDDTTDGVEPLGNRVYRYELVNDELVKPKLILDLPALPGPRHTGGIVAIGPDGNLYVTLGDLDGTFRKNYQTMAQNYQNGTYPDGRSGILRVSQQGEPVGAGILGDKYPLNLYYAYGIRNSFGIDWDPITGHLWDTENGPHYGDEINLVEPGFNSGWVAVQGIWIPDFDEKGELVINPKAVVTFDGKGKYSTPEFIWIPPVAPTAIKFLDSDKLGTQYRNDIFAADTNTGSIYHFHLNEKRTGLRLTGPLADNIADSSKELNDIIFASGFGRITDIDIGPEGYLYVLSSEDKGAVVYKIFPS